MPLSPIPPTLSTSAYEHLVLEALAEIAGPSSTVNINPPILSTADFRHLVLHALQYIATHGGGGNGATGPQGATGAQGSTGATGIQGNVGATGATGIQGNVGATGATGAQGNVGATGATGIQGNIGSTGATGSQGNVGATGATGIQGNIGSTGATGAQGNVGATGATGVQGNDGATGTQGTTGFQGATGADGATGFQGATGIDGATGVQGATGPVGPQGQSSSFYDYRANTNSQTGDPGNTYLLWNNITQISSTQINVNHIDKDNYDIDVFLALIKQNDTFIIQDSSLSDNYQKWLVTGTPIPQTGYVEFPVSLISSGGTGTTNFANNHDILFIVISAGNQGATGLTGPQGATGLGATGLQGATGFDGATGVDGNIGATGFQGATGVDGQTGSTGVQGDVGATGATGPQGNIGATGTTGNQGATGLGATGFTGATGPIATAPLYQATYYKSTNQNLTNGSTDITFDQDASWNNDNGLITHTAGSADFVVSQAGLYQLEFNLSVNANAATWNTSNSKVVSIDITRSPNAEQVVIGQTAVTATTQSYTQSVVSTFKLEVGDVINLRHYGNFATATPFAQGVQNTIDLNTWFTWRFVEYGPQGPVGATGIQGNIGATGAGDIGATGANGDIGATGLQGATGTAPASVVQNVQSDATPVNFIRMISQATYDAIVTKDPNTLYIIQP